MKQLRTLLEGREHLVRFGIAGVANTAVHFIVFTVLHPTVSVAIANVLAFVAANIFSFFVASYFVFQVRTHSLPQYLHFFAVSSFGAVVSYGIGQFCSAFALHAYAAPALVVLVMPPLSYLLQRSVFWGKKSPRKK